MKLFRKLRSLFRRESLDAEMAVEMQAHVDMQTERNVATGMNPDEARYTALRQFGNVGVIQEQAREGRGWVWLEQTVKDFSVAVRRLARSSLFSIVVVAILGVCLAGNLTIFAWVDAILLRPLPFPQPDKLALIFNSYPQAGVMRDGASATNYYERRGHLPAFSGLALYQPSAAIVGEPNAMQREAVMRVTAEFFEVLGRGPVLGRAFTPEETASWTTGRVVVLSDTYWHQHFEADPQVIGRQLPVNGMPHTVVGVLPPDFRFLSFAAPLYFPFVSPPEEHGPANRHSGGNVTQMIARLSPRADLRSAQAQIDAHNAAMEKDSPEAGRMRAAGFRSMVVSLHDDHVAGIRPTLWLMQAGGLLLLMIGAANLVNLLLLRATERRKDIAVRQALGANRRNVVTEVMAEIMLLTLVGGTLGLVAGEAGIKLAASLGAERLPLGAQVVLDIRLALLTAGGVMVLGTFVGLVVAGQVLRIDPRAALLATSHGTTANRGMRRLRHVLLVVQLTLAFVLLAAASQLVVSFRKSLAVFPGFQVENVLTEKMWISPASSPSQAAYIAVTERVVSEIARQPGVTAAGLVTNIPFGGLNGMGAVTPKDWTPPVRESPRGHYLYNVTGDYFLTMNVALRAGRFLTMDDSRRSDRVCVVDEDFARHYWPGQAALGHVVFQGSESGKEADGYVVVGVVGRVKHSSLTDNETPGAVYFPLGHRPDRDVYIVVRTGQTQRIAGEALHRTVKDIDPKLSLSELRPMQSRLDDSLISRRSPAMLGGIFAGVALLLAAVGTYGLLSYAVSQQYREISIRMALGARPGQISRQFLSLGVLLLAWAAILGSVGIWVTGRAMQAILFEVQVFPLGIWMGVVAVMTGVTLVSCLLPARRAAKVDPMIALRAE